MMSSCESRISEMIKIFVIFFLRLTSCYLVQATKIVKVKFMLQKKCEFGQRYNIVGDDAQFGSWDPAAAIPMEWSEGHIWTTELGLSVGTRVEFKVILTGRPGELEWQPGPNCVLHVSEALASVLISESWSGERFPGNIPPLQAVETTNPFNDEACDALRVSHAAFYEDANKTGDTAAQALAVLESVQETGGRQFDENATDVFLISDTKLPVKTDPETSEDVIMRRAENASTTPQQKLSVLQNDLVWCQQALSNFWSVFKWKHHNKKTKGDVR